MSYIHPWQVVALALLAGYLVYVRRKRPAASGLRAPAAANVATTKAAARVEPTAEEAYLDLRRQAFETDPQRLGLAGEPGPDEPYAVLMEMGISDSVVTLACFADGDARVFYKTGGGMVGGISHESVRRAARDLIALAAKALPGMTRTTSYPLPAGDRVRFYVLTRRGVSTTESDRQALGERGSELSPLFQSGQEVVAQMRQAGEQRAQDAP